MKFLSRIFHLMNLGKVPSFIIDGVDEDKDTGLRFFWVKIQNKFGAPVKKDPIELLRASRAKNYFSSKDYDWIIDIMLHNQKKLIESKFKKNYLLIKHQVSEELLEPLIVFSDINNNMHIKPAKDIYYNIELLKQFNSADSACIGNIVGSYESERELKLKQSSKNNITKCDILALSRV